MIHKRKIFFALCLILFSALSVLAQAPTLSSFQDTVQNSLGQVIPNATVIVLSGTIGGGLAVNTTTQPGSPLATIYSDPYGANPINQSTLPLNTAAGDGTFQFWAAPGYYVVQIYGPGINGQITYGISLGGSAFPNGGVFIGPPESSFDISLQGWFANTLPLPLEITYFGSALKNDGLGIIGQGDGSAIDTIQLGVAATDGPIGALFQAATKILSGTNLVAYGVVGNASILGGGTIADAASFSSSAPGLNTGSTGNITNLEGYKAGAPEVIGSGTISNAYGFRALKQGGNGRITNSYGFYADDAGTGANDWSYYSAGGKNFFGGPFQFQNSTSGMAAYVQSTTITLTSAQIKTLNTAPTQVLPDPGIGKTYLITNVLGHYRHVTTAYTIGSLSEIQLIFNTNTGSPAFALGPGVTFLDQATDAYVQGFSNGNPIPTADQVHKAVFLYGQGGNPSVGDGTLTLSIQYTVIDTTVM